MKIQNLILALAFIFVCTLNGQTQVTPKLTKTQIKQQKRIKKGVQSNELTRRETKKLVQQQRNIQNTKRVAKADGVVTRKERVTIRRQQKNASANIYRKKNNNISRN
jgi:uncharacterized Zn finger protein (UPF0148 family)